MAIFVFIAVKQKSLRINSNNNFIECIAGVSLGVYLLHFFVRDLFMMLYWNYIRVDWLYMIFEPFAVGTVTIVIVVLLSRIKFVKKFLFSI